jgi:NADPH:quinone reductase-like Zn-dependent oxidoreductase
LLKPKDILVEVKAASLNPIDYKLVEGKLKDMISLDLPITIGCKWCGDREKQV